MGIPNLALLKKSYMLEFLVDGKSEEIWTFSIPPENEDFDFPQRMTETKTFGGSVFDRYGNDTARISLSGTTGNEDSKVIYRGLKMPKYLDGEREIWEFQRLVEKWHRLEKGGKETKVYLYDLSKMNALQFAAASAGSGSQSAGRNWWRVVVKGLKIRRSSAKPNSFSYTLEMLALSEEREADESKISAIAKAARKFTAAIDAFQGVMDVAGGAVSAVQSAVSAFNRCKNEFERYSNMGAATIALDVAKKLDGGSRILAGGSGNSFYGAARDFLAVTSRFEIIDVEEGRKSRSEGTAVYAVAFNSNGGTSVKSQKVEYSETAERPEDPTLDRFAFAGWYSDSALTEEYDFSAEVVRNLTLFAKWTLKTATITFNSRNGSSVAPEYVAVGQRGSMPESPTRKGFSFDRWNTDYAGSVPFDWETPVVEDMTLYASWTSVAVVTFDTLGGSEVESQTVRSGERVVYPLTPTKENSTFARWCDSPDLSEAFDFGRAVFEDTTLWAEFVRVSNTVSFRSNGGSETASQTVLIGGFAQRPENPEREGFDFVMWCDDINLTNEFLFEKTPINGDKTLWARWTGKTFTVEFDTGGGSYIDAQSVGYGKLAFFPDIPTKEGAVFTMWRKRETVNVGTEDEPVYEDVYTEYDFSEAVVSNLTLYAKWLGGE